MLIYIFVDNIHTMHCMLYIIYMLFMLDCTMDFINEGTYVNMDDCVACDAIECTTAGDNYYLFETHYCEG